MKTPTQPTMHETILVQNTIVTWTKRQRTSAQAGLRTQIPHALPLPERAPLPPGHVGLMGNIYYHSLYYGPRDDYRVPREYWDVATSQFSEPATLKLPSSGLIGAQITCRPTSEGMRIEFDWAATGERLWLVDKREVRTLAPGQWLRMRFNRRIVTWDEPYYTIHVLNLGYAHSIRRTLFIDTPPTHEIDDWHQLR